VQSMMVVVAVTNAVMMMIKYLGYMYTYIHR